MPAHWFILHVLALIASLGLGVYWSVVLVHVFRTLRRIPTASRGVGVADLERIPPDERPRVRVVVPAHNERECIGTLARSLAGSDYPNLDVVFALDRCTDDTEDRIRAAVGDDARFRILRIAECPPDWAGKVHAIWRGVQDSAAAKDADILLFVDADTVLHPRCITHTVALLRSRDLGLLSLLSTLTCETMFEFVAQAPAGMELARQFPIERANAKTRRRAFANGQFLMMTRAAYTQIGGHERVKDELLEDMAIARACEAHAIASGLFLADGMHVCRMYATWAEFRRGWKRIYTECAKLRVKRLRTAARRVRLTGVWLPLLTLTAVALGGAGLGVPPDDRGAAILAQANLTLGLLGLFCFAGALAACYRTSRTPALAVLAYPFGSWFVGGILHEAAADLIAGKPTRWGGREYMRKAR